MNTFYLENSATAVTIFWKPVEWVQLTTQHEMKNFCIFVFKAPETTGACLVVDCQLFICTRNSAWMQWLHPNTVLYWRNVWLQSGGHIFYHWTTVVSVAVYLPPWVLMRQRHCGSCTAAPSISKHYNSFVIADDFNHTGLKTAMSKFYQ